MEGFTVSLALLDYLPVIFFGVAVLVFGIKLQSTLFIVGAVISLLAGVRKATWKLVLGITNKDVPILGKYFLPIQFTGFGIMILALIINCSKLNFAALFEMPRLLFLIFWAACMGLMSWYKKNKFDKYNAKSNWIAEIINTAAQLFLLLAVVV